MDFLNFFKRSKPTTTEPVQVPSSSEASSSGTRSRKSIGTRSLFGQAMSSAFQSDWFQSSSSINVQLESQLPKLRKRSRDLRCSNPFIINYAQFVKDNVVGQGFGFQSQCMLNDGTLDEVNNTKIEAAFARWSKKVDVAGRHSLTQFLRLMADTLATDGEVFVELVEVGTELRLRMIDAQLIPLSLSNVLSPTGNRIRMGIEYDADDRPLSYRVSNGYEGETPSYKVRVVPANKMIHLFVSDFVGQERGIPWNSSVQDTLRQLAEFSKNELLKAKLSANTQKFIQYTDAALAADSELSERIPLDELTYDTTPGAIVMLDPGLEIAGDSTTQLPTDYRGFVQAQLKQVASGLRVSYPALASDFSDVNYSSMRSALLVEREFWKGIQQLFVDGFLHPLYEAWLPHAILNRVFIPTGSVLPSRYFDVKFLPRGWAWVDPLKDVKANTEAINAGLTSRSAVLAESGTDFENVMKDLAREKRLAEQYGVDLSTMTNSTTDTPSDPSQV